jgi:predicted nucleic acid-binding protein
VLDELEDVLRRKINLPDKQITSILQYLRAYEIIEDYTPLTKIELRDKNDIPVISAALNSHSDIIVTGDKDLLEVSEKYGIKIVDSRTFFQLIKGIDNPS